MNLEKINIITKRKDVIIMLKINGKECFVRSYSETAVDYVLVDRNTGKTSIEFTLIDGKVSEDGAQKILMKQYKGKNKVPAVTNVSYSKGAYAYPITECQPFAIPVDPEDGYKPLDGNAEVEIDEK